MHTYKNRNFNNIINLLYSFLKLSFVVLAFMLLARVYLFMSYGTNSIYSSSELLNAFWLGFRLDVSIIAYISILPVLFNIFIWLFKKDSLKPFYHHFFRLYYIYGFSLFFFFCRTLNHYDIWYF